MVPKGIFFDLYGTLLIYGDMASAWADWHAEFYRRFKSYGLAISEAEFVERCHGFFDWPPPASANDRLTIYERRVRDFGKKLALDLSEAQCAETADSCVAAWQKYVSLDPEAGPLLEKLKRKHKLALVSNFDHPRYVTALLRKLELTDHFEAVVISGEHEFKKPDRRIFDVALEHTGLTAVGVVHVGDSPDDIDGAAAAGIEAILIQRDGNMDYRHTTTITCLSQLPQLLG